MTIAQAPLWFENLLDGWWGTLILAVFCALDVLLLCVIFYRAFMKRLLDILVSLIGILILTPVWLILTPIVAIKMKGNPFFVQTRPGKKTKLFKLIKYRTMTTARDADGKLLPDAERLTRFGKTMRALSLDELPELFNIFLGQMSLIGPRPLLVEYIPLYTRDQARRHEVRPGLTGLAQVNGRNASGWEERFALDVFYVDHFTFFGDVKIFFLTIVKVFKREGIAEAGQATRSYFTGSGDAGFSEGSPVTESADREAAASCEKLEESEDASVIATNDGTGADSSAELTNDEDVAPATDAAAPHAADGDTVGTKEAAATEDPVSFRR